jgi:hypothetical protein
MNENIINTFCALSFATTIADSCLMGKLHENKKGRAVITLPWKEIF